MRNINEIIVHTTATKPYWMDNFSTEAKVAEIRRWHVEDNGWSDIGYHYVIDRDGTVGVGRPIERKGAHVRGHNDNSIGIALIGGFGGSANDAFSDHYTEQQDYALRNLIKTLDMRFLGNLKITGHNQYANKACPCFHVPSWYNRTGKRTKTNSKTLQAAGGGAAATVAAGGGAVAQLEGNAQIVALVLVAFILIAFAIIFRERIKKWAKGVEW